MKTASNRRSQGDGVEKEKASGKKLKQARLPFKILSTPSGEKSEGVAAPKIVKDSADVRKRKLSLNEKEETGSNVIEQSSKRRSVRNNTSTEASAKKRNDTASEAISKKTKAAGVIELSDSNDSDGNAEHNDSGCKENLKAVVKQKPSSNKEESNDMHSDDAELIESTDDEETKVTEKSKPAVIATEPASSKKTKGGVINTTPASNKKSTQNSTKPTTTPQSGSKAVKNTTRKSTGDGNSVCKLQIKLPISGKKNKRRKQISKVNESVIELEMPDEMSDDVEIISKELHPQKRPKLDIPVDNETVAKETSESGELAKDEKEKTGEDEAVTETSTECKEMKTKDVDQIEKVISKDVKQKRDVTQPEQSIKNPVEPEKESTVVETESNQLESEDLVSESEPSKSKIHDISSTTSDLEADTEAETTVNSERSQKIINKNSSKINAIGKIESPKVTGDSNILKIQKKNLTPKQLKLHDQRLKAREEKERKIQEERLQKQREKEERELAKKREREEKEEQRRKEREEKEEQRRKEREEKEIKRLAEIEAKNEEKRKRNEAKEEELRKKEDERKRKEQEKEEAEMKKKKAAMAFTKFFSRPAQVSTGQRTTDHTDSEENHELLAFRPFQIKGDMKLAPIVRKKLTDEERTQLVSFMEKEELQNFEEERPLKLYLSELKTGTKKPYKWSPPTPNETEAVASEQEERDNDEVMIVEDELEGAGQAIVEEHNVPVEHYRAKFYKFCENRRPPYFGTWRKKSTVITPRRPLAQDKKFFDYEVDSDEEWEEEEPGESLDGSDDDKEKESEDEDYEVDNEWFVPHGHLSEEEMQNEDDLGENNDREAQKAKLQILQQEFAQEMKKKTEKIKPRLIGCIWVDENGNQPELCPKIIWDTLNMRAILCGEPPIMEEIKSNVDKNGEMNITNGQNGEKTNGESKLKPITLTESMLKELIKLIHGNTHSKAFLIKEFIAYIEANEESVRNGDVRGPLKSAVREKIDEYAQWQVIETTSNNNENSKDGNKSAKTPKSKKKLCWIVSNESLQKMNLNTLELDNNWNYILQPRIRSRVSQKEETTPIVIANGEDSNGNSEASVDHCNTVSGNATNSQTPVHAKNNRNANIKIFTKVLTAEEKVQQLQKQVEQMRTPSNKKAANTSPSTTNCTPKSNISKPSGSVGQTPKAKKRVPLLISVARGQSISTPDKNARISHFLKTINDAKEKEKQENAAAATPMDTDSIIVLE